MSEQATTNRLLQQVIDILERQDARLKTIEDYAKQVKAAEQNRQTDAVRALQNRFK